MCYNVLLTGICHAIFPVSCMHNYRLLALGGVCRHNDEHIRSCVVLPRIEFTKFVTE